MLFRTFACEARAQCLLELEEQSGCKLLEPFSGKGASNGEQDQIKQIKDQFSLWQRQLKSCKRYVVLQQ